MTGNFLKNAMQTCNGSHLLQMVHFVLKTFWYYRQDYKENKYLHAQIEEWVKSYSLQVCKEIIVKDFTTTPQSNLAHELD